MKKITELTEDQRAQLPIYRDKWIKIGLSTEPADRKTAEEGVKYAYTAVGLAAPRIVWCTSPMAGAITYTILQKLFKEKNASVWDSVRDNVRDSISDNVWESVEESVRKSAWASVGDSVYKAGYGQHDASWIGFYDYFEQVCGLKEECNKMLGLRMISQSSGWWWPMQNLCLLTERPIFLAKDEQERLHCNNRAAIEYPDGWGVYSIHGIRVKDHIILEKNL